MVEHNVSVYITLIIFTLQVDVALQDWKHWSRDIGTGKESSTKSVFSLKQVPRESLPIGLTQIWKEWE